MATPRVPTIPPPALSKPVRDVLLNLSGFLKSKAEVNADASSHMPEKFMHRYDSFKRESHMSQMVVDKNGAKRPANSYADLKALADEALPIYNATLRRVVECAGLKPDELAVHKGKKLGLDANKGLYYKKLTTAPIKGEGRCTEKVNKEYIPEGGGWHSVVDVVRSSIVVNTENELLAVAEALAAEGKPISLLGTQARAGDYVIIRLKNRYKQPCFNGYQDALYSISISLGNGQWMVCEVQVHLAAVLVHKETSHKYYEFMRSYFSGSSSYESRMALLDKVGGDSSTTPEAIVKAAFTTGDVQKLRALKELLGALGDVRAVVAVAQRLEQATATSDGRVRPVKEELEQKMQIGAALRKAGKYAEAKQVLQEAFDRCRAELGETDVITLACVNSLALALEEQGKLDEAMPLYRRALTGKEAALGSTHPSTLNSVNNLALALKAQGKLKEANQIKAKYNLS